jgi:very-short-patch-repair endonuclease
VAQAIACGLTPGQIRHRFRTGRWERVGSRSFRVTGAPATWEQQLMLGLLDLGHDAVVSMRAAAALHGFEGFAPTPVEFTIPRRTGGAKTVWQVHTTKRWDRIDRTAAGGFPCTSASRTIVDLAAVATESQLSRAIDSAVRDGSSSPTFLRKRLTDLRGSGRAGVRILDELMPDTGGESNLERCFLRLVRTAGLPRPVCQQIVRRDGVTIARVDFRFPGTKVIVEVSGRRGHVSDPERAKDAWRRNELQAAGFVVLEFTNDHIRRTPAAVIATLRFHLGM